MATLNLLFRRVIFIALALTFSTAMADEPKRVLSPTIIDRIADSATPLTERERLFYDQVAALPVKEKEVGERDQLLIEWLERSAAAKPFEDLRLALQQDQARVWKRMLRSESMKIEDYNQFFAESLLLFRMLRNGQSKGLLDGQFLYWRKAWLKIDMRLLKSPRAIEWSNVLVQTFALAFAEAGPWSIESENRVEAYFAQRPEFVGRTRPEILRSLLPFMKNATNAQENRGAVAALGAAVGTFAASVTLLTVLSKLISLLGPMPSAIWAPFVASGTLVTFYTPYLAVQSALRWPGSYEFLGKRFSLMFSPNGLRCQDLLAHEKLHD